MAVGFRRTSIAAVLFVVFIVAPVQADDSVIRPRLVTLVRADDVLHLLGTLHRIPDEAVPNWLHVADPVAAAIRSSDIVYLESHQGENQAARIRAARFGSPSVGEMIEQWDPERRGAFLDALDEFPRMDHISRKNSFLRSRPFAAQLIIDAQKVALTEFAGAASIDGWVAAVSEEAGIPISGLEHPATGYELLANIDQVPILLSIEALLLKRPTQELVASASAASLRQGYYRWADGGDIGREITAFRDALGFQPGSAGYDPYPDAQSALGIERERIWVDELERTFDARNPLVVFAAVGASHLQRKDGRFIDQLQSLGWTIVSD